MFIVQAYLCWSDCSRKTYFQLKKEKEADVVANTLNEVTEHARKATSGAWEWLRSKPALAPVLDKLEVCRETIIIKNTQYTVSCHI
jgi:hypothetical protein